MTKYTDSITLERMISIMGLQRRSGRARIAPQMTQDEVCSIECIEEVEDIENGIKNDIIDEVELNSEIDYIYSDDHINIFPGTELNTYQEIENLFKQIDMKGDKMGEHRTGLYECPVGRLPGVQPRHVALPPHVTGVKERRQQDRPYRWIRQRPVHAHDEHEPNTETLRTPLCTRHSWRSLNYNNARVRSYITRKPQVGDERDAEVLRDRERRSRIDPGI